MIRDSVKEFLRCCVLRRSIAYTHQYERGKRNMYRSFASLGVVNDLTCLIIIYYVFLGRKKQRAGAENV